MIAALAAAIVLAQIPQTAPLPTAPCSDAFYHQFDFLVGDWQAREPGGTDVTAQISVAKAAGGCGLIEQETPTRGVASVSLLAYDEDATLWRRDSAFGDGLVLSLQGGVQNGDLVLEGEQSGSQSHQLARITWRAQGEVVRETGERSPDGQTWSPWFDRELRRSR
ncbi:MAG TPA: hypothetical protein VG248_15745 [Caulobacteraceae bacterium]|nr:hypothetical protein [Caulobacteraceae bacterium]